MAIEFDSHIVLSKKEREEYVLDLHVQTKTIDK